jgi:glycosyltransferase A (GT-A) superfamily protein (DUF2064 family)
MYRILNFTRAAVQVLIVGTDIPNLTAAALTTALGLLDAHDLAFGPARDGGYYLVGMTRSQPQLFQDVEWSTPTVLQSTLQNAKLQDLSVPCPLDMPVLMDIDVIQVRCNVCLMQWLCCGCAKVPQRVQDLQIWMQEHLAENPEGPWHRMWQAACDAVGT